MPSLPLRLSALLLALSLAACDDAPRFTKAEPGEAHPGGRSTVGQHDRKAFSMPSANLSPMRRLDFSVGDSFFRTPGGFAGGDGNSVFAEHFFRLVFVQVHQALAGGKKRARILPESDTGRRFRPACCYSLG